MKKATPRHASDCVAACLASILGLDISEVPDFWNLADNATEAYELERKWLNLRGYHLLFSSCDAISFIQLKKQGFQDGYSWPCRGYWMARMQSMQGQIDHEPGHVVVMRNCVCVFNPGATVKDLYERDDVFIVGHFVLSPLDPSERK